MKHKATHCGVSIIIFLTASSLPELAPLLCLCIYLFSMSILLCALNIFVCEHDITIAATGKLTSQLASQLLLERDRWDSSYELWCPILLTGNQCHPQLWAITSLYTTTPVQSHQFYLFTVKNHQLVVAQPRKSRASLAFI